MHKGIPVVISENGYGIPVTPVESGAPSMIVSENGFGTPVVITENGTPFIIDGIGPDDPKWQTFFLIAGNNAFGWGYAIPPMVSAPLGDILNEPYTGSNLIAFFEAPDDSRIIVCFSGNLVSELTGHTFNINGATLDVMTPPVYDAVNDWTIMYLESFWMIEGQAYVIYRVEATNVFSPSELFANGEQGAWYDPSDLSTMFQDVAGTIPALPGDPVGLVLDKSGNVINLSQPTAAARPTLARMPKTGRRNLLTYTDKFTPGWLRDNVTTTLNGTELTVISNAVSGNHRVLQNLNLSGSVSGTIEAKAAGYDWLKIRVGSVAYANLNLQTGEIGVSEGVILSTPILTGDGFWRVAVRADGGSSALLLHGMPTNQSGNDASYLGDGVSGIIIRNPQLELGEPTPYQKVTNAFDVTEAGVPDCYYLRLDLTDDALTTTLPQAINGDILIAGRNGTIIEPVNYAAGSTFTLGPTTYTGGTPGIMAALGDIVGVLLIDKTLSQVERDNLVAYYQAKGAGGLL